MSFADEIGNTTDVSERIFEVESQKNLLWKPVYKDA